MLATKLRPGDLMDATCRVFKARDFLSGFLFARETGRMYFLGDPFGKPIFVMAPRPVPAGSKK